MSSVRTEIVNTPTREGFDTDVAQAIDALAAGASVLSVSVAPIKQVQDGEDILTRRVLVTIVVDADPPRDKPLVPLARRGR